MSETCPICLELIAEVNCATTSCGHKFHLNCIHSSFISLGVGCPCCRGQSIKPVDINPVDKPVEDYAYMCPIRYSNIMTKYFKDGCSFSVVSRTKFYIDRTTFENRYFNIVQEEAILLGENWNWAIKTDENIQLFRQKLFNEADRRIDLEWKKAKLIYMTNKRHPIIIH